MTIMTLQWFLLCWVLLAFSAFAAADTTTTNNNNNRRTCIELTRAKELKQKYLEEYNHVLVVMSGSGGGIGEEQEDDDDKVYKELCERYENTAQERVKDLVIAKLSASDHFRTKLLDQSQPAPRTVYEWVLSKTIGLAAAGSTISSDDDTTHYILYPKLPLPSEKTSTTTTTTSTVEDWMANGIRYVGSENNGDDDDEATKTTTTPPTVDEISTFLSLQLKRKKIGSFVYSLGTSDLIANQLMLYSSLLPETENNNDGLSSSWKVKGWAYIASAIHFLFKFHPSSLQTPFNTELSDMYRKTSWKVLQQGPTYPSTQIIRLERMIDNENAKQSISELQKEHILQRIHILKRFRDYQDLSVTDEDVRSFLVQTGLNVLVWIFLIVMVLYTLFVPVEEENSDEVEEEEEVVFVNEEEEEEEEWETKKDK